MARTPLRTALAPRRPARDSDLAYEIAVEAYIYLYPLVLMDITRRQVTNVERPGGVVGRGPMDVFTHIREFPPAGFHDMPRVNFDTLYSFAWIDVGPEPMILTVPDAGDRYFLLTMYDMWSDVFACPGTRTTGNDPGQFAIVGRDWDAELPRGVRRLEAPTPHVWIIGRTQCDGTDDYAHTNAFQDQLELTPLSRWTRQPTPDEDVVAAAVDPSVDGDTPPVQQLKNMSAVEFFAYATSLLAIHPPHLHDHPILDRMERIGIVPGLELDVTPLPDAVRDAFAPAAAEAQLRLYERFKQVSWQRNGWIMNTESMGAWGTNYLKRATVDRIGLNAVQPEDAIYPTTFVDADGEPLDGRRSYVLHFERDELPPVRSFWSLTLYDDDGFVFPSPLNRYVLRDRDPLVHNEDGSLDLMIQPGPPPPELEPNWLPTGDGPFNLCLRLYWAKLEALDRTWAPPAVYRVA